MTANFRCYQQSFIQPLCIIIFVFFLSYRKNNRVKMNEIGTVIGRTKSPANAGEMSNDKNNFNENTPIE